MWQSTNVVDYKIIYIIQGILHSKKKVCYGYMSYDL